MSITIAALAELLLAVLALEWAHTRVHAQMIDHVAKLDELFLTGEAFKYLILPTCLLV